VGAILSILLNPFIFAVIGRLKPTLEARIERTAPQPDQVVKAPKDEDAPWQSNLTGHTVLVGYGRVGSLVAPVLRSANLPFLVIEDSEKIVAKLHKEDIETVLGNAANPAILRAANITEAARLIITTPNTFEAGQVVEQAKAANPSITVISRAHAEAEAEYLSDLGADLVIIGEQEIARAMAAKLMADIPSKDLQADQTDKTDGDGAQI
jgi:CPA2 family monovalent cation:H+ antiporter-2